MAKGIIFRRLNRAYKQAGGISKCCVSTSSLTQEDIIKERERIIEKYKNNFMGYNTKKIS
jgi:hypothetical protein